MPKTKKARSKDRVIPFARGFHPPTQKQQISAVGFGKKDIPRDFAPGENEDFFPLVPQPTSIDDWLAQYDEEGQTFDQFRKECPWLSKRRLKYMRQKFESSGLYLRDKYPEGVIYIMPLGDFHDTTAPSFSALLEYANAFFGVPVKEMPGVALEIEGDEVYWVVEPSNDEDDSLKGRRKRKRRQRIESRYHAKSGKRQLQVAPVLSQLRAGIPDDALCCIALTMQDLYDEEPDLFVAGMAAGAHRVAVFSFARYDPCLTFSQEFWYKIQATKPVSAELQKRQILLRSCKLLVHEVSHLLGIDHCIFYSCCMNGSGHLAEDFRQPMFLCPVDLHKLQHLCGFSVVERYKQLLRFFIDYNMEEESEWVRNRLTYIQD